MTCKHEDHKPCRARDCFFVGMDHCHESRPDTEGEQDG